MNSQDTLLAYQRINAHSASALGQVVALYDGILRDFRRAIAAIEANDVENRVGSLNHALTIIAELQGVLDFEKGGKPAKTLQSFYNVARPMVLEASMTVSREKLRELIDMFTSVRNAWATAEKTVAPTDPTERFRITAGVAASQQPRSAPAAPGESHSGGWSA